jgi:hypothetical protein
LPKQVMRPQPARRLAAQFKRDSVTRFTEPRSARVHSSCSTAFNGMRLLNIEFLSRCCARVSQMMKKSEQDLSDNAKALEDAVRALANPDLKSAA